MLPAAVTTVAANPDSYASVFACPQSATSCQALIVSDPSKGVIANDLNVYGVKVSTPPTQGTLTLNANGTFTYVPNPGWSSPDTFAYQANGNGPTATVTLSAAPVELAGGISCSNSTFTSNVATSLSIQSPGILSACTDAAGYPLTVVPSSVVASSGLSVSVDKSGAFVAAVPSANSYTFAFSVPVSYTHLTLPTILRV